jgi:hypothetical protein
MNWLVEDPLWIVLVGVVATAVLVVAWLKTGRAPILYAAIAAVALTALLLAVERMVVTDREAVRQALLEMKADAEANDADRLLAHVHSNAHEVRADIERYYGLFRVDHVFMSPRLKDIVVDADNDPPVATAEFNVRVIGRVRGTEESQQVLRFLVVTLYLEDGQWRVGNYRHEDAMEGVKQRDEAPETTSPRS